MPSRKKDRGKARRVAKEAKNKKEEASQAVVSGAAGSNSGRRNRLKPDAAAADPIAYLKSAYMD